MKDYFNTYCDSHANDVLTEVLRERYRQDSKWGVQNHSFPIWLMILSEEFGEVAKEANEFYFAKIVNGGGLDPDWIKARRKYGQNYREELIQVAAVAVAMVESYDRNEANEMRGEQDAD